jgi:hypothetical protein
MPPGSRCTARVRQAVAQVGGRAVFGEAIGVDDGEKQLAFLPQQGGHVQVGEAVVGALRADQVVERIGPAAQPVEGASL